MVTPYSWNTILSILSVGILSFITAASLTCNVRDTCVSEGTCKTSDRFSSCSFSNVVSVRVDAAYARSYRFSYADNNSTNYSVESSGLQHALRGICSPGDRFQRDTITGDSRCIPYYPFPVALNEEIMDSEAASPHMKACGKWIESGGVTFAGYSTSRASENHDEWISALGHAEDSATSSSGNAKDAMSKFRSECSRTKHAGTHATRNAAVLAYAYLESEIDRVSDSTSLIHAIGFLAGHYCEAPVNIGNWPLRFDSSRGKFRITIGDGWIPGGGVLAEALQLVGVSGDVQSGAESATDAIRILSDTAPMSISVEDVQTLLLGATGLEDLSKYTDFPYENYGSKALASVVAHYAVDADGVKSYLRGLCAFCCVGLLSNVQDVGILTNGEMRSLAAARPHTAAPRRIYTNYSEPVKNDTGTQAETITVSNLAGHASGNVDADCLHFMRWLFIDDVDAHRFSATVDYRLYERLESLVETLRIGMRDAVMSWPLTDVLTNASHVAHRVRTAGIRIAGAPRGTWAGIKRPIPDPVFSGSDGMFLMALKQLRTVYKDSIVSLSLEEVDRCDHTPSMGSVTMNAYMWYGTPACSVLFLGMAHRPYMDAQYDDTSLLSRGVGIIAHELGHLLGHMVYTPTDFVTEAFEELLQHYTTYIDPSYAATYKSEAMADVAGALAVIKTGVDKETYLMNFCQLKCARTPFGWTAYAYTTHPEHNQRCDYLYKTITDTSITPA
jgi:hypothetical protein